MKASTNLFHPNTHLEFCQDFLRVRVSLCVSRSVGEILSDRFGNVQKSKHRTVFFLTYSTRNYTKDNIVHIQRFLLNELMIRIRQAKIDIYTDQQLTLYDDNMKNRHINVIGRAISSKPTHKYF